MGFFILVTLQSRCVCKMKAAQILKPSEPLQIQQTETPKPKGSQVLVKVNSSGVCHSDIHLWQGGYEGPAGQFLKTTDRGVKYPITPGHEIAGTIESMGEEAEAQIQKTGQRGGTAATFSKIKRLSCIHG